MSVPQELLELVERFNTNREAYRSGQYNETQLRREFIDPFFQLLGWDVNNKNGYAEAYKDVIHEDSIKIGGLTKAPDYCFRIGGVRKFFVETKRPSVNIKEDLIQEIKRLRKRKKYGLVWDEEKTNAIELANKLRNYTPPIFARIEQDRVLLDMRTAYDEEVDMISRALENVFSS